jgi:arylformamidase
MAFYDVSVPLRPGMPLFEGDPPLHIERVSSLADGGICNLSRIEGSLHSGTHVDAPCHFIDGAGGVETIATEALMGPCVVVDATRFLSHLGADDVARLVPAGAERVLFRTSNGGLWERAEFSRDSVALRQDAAEALAARGVRLVGIDYLSIAPFEDPAPSHVALLGARVAVLEGLDLRGVEAGTYELICLPLLIPGADGAPARAFLRR